MRLPWRGLAILAAAVLFWVGWELADPRSQQMLRQSHGMIVEGAFMGVSVGAPTADAVRQLVDAGFSDVRYYVGGMDNRFVLDATKPESVFMIEPWQTEVVLAERSWRSGAVILIDDGGRVIRIVWRFDPFRLPI